MDNGITSFEAAVTEVDFDGGVEVKLPEASFLTACSSSTHAQAPVDIERRIAIPVQLLETDVGFADQSVLFRNERDIDRIRLHVDLWPVRLIVGRRASRLGHKSRRQ